MPWDYQTYTSHFHNCTFNPTESDFVELENQINNTYNNCIIKISELCPSIKNEEIKVHVMIKADIPLKISFCF